MKEFYTIGEVSKIFKVSTDTLRFYDKINLIKKVISKVYPMKAAGDIINYRNNYFENSFTCTIEEKENMDSSVIYVPDIHLIGEIIVEPYEKGYKLEQIEGSDAGFIIIPASEHKLIRIIVMKMKREYDWIHTGHALFGELH